MIAEYDLLDTVQSGLAACRTLGCTAIVYGSRVEGHRRLQHGENPEHSALFYQTGDQGIETLCRYGDGLPALEWITQCHQRLV